MTKTYMRVSKELLNKLKEKKQVPRESYADVVKRMLNQETKLNQENKEYYSHDEVVSRLRSQMGERIWNSKKGRKGQSLMPTGF